MICQLATAKTNTALYYDRQIYNRRGQLCVIIQSTISKHLRALLCIVLQYANLEQQMPRCIDYKMFFSTVKRQHHI